MFDEEKIEPKKLEIPSEWRFKEKDDPDLQPAIIDKKLGLLSFKLPDKPLSPTTPSHVVYGDYSFDVNGNPIDSRIYTDTINGFYIDVKFKKDIEKSFYISEELSSEDAKLRVKGVPIPPSSQFALSVDFSSPLARKEPSYEDRDLGKLWFSPVADEVLLTRVYLGEVFTRDQDGKLIASPDYVIWRNESSTGEKIEDWKFNPYNWNRPPFMYELKSDNEAIIKKDGKEVYEIHWEFDDKGRIMVTETHLPSGIQKILHSSLRFNIVPVLNMAAAKPPYQNRSLGKMEVLDIPWKNLDRVVSADLEYQYPPEQKQPKEASEDLEEF